MNATRARGAAESGACGRFVSLAGGRWRTAIGRLAPFLFVLLCTLAAGQKTAVGQTRSAAGLQYPWSKGDEIAYTFDIEAEVQGSTMNFTGSCNYRPRKAGDADLDRRSGTGTGTAFVVNGNGYLVTCAHVVEGGTKFMVKLGQTELAATVEEVDREQDLALLKVPTSGLPVLPLGDSKKVQVAQEIRVVGYPLSSVLGNSIKVTTGSVAGVVEHEGRRLFQVDAAVNPGNSGGPVINDRGEVIGIASAKLAGFEISNVGFAVPVEEARQLLERKGILDTAAGSATPLTGPELARRATPAVALVTVTVGPGGLGSGDRYRLLFNGTRERRTRAGKLAAQGQTVVKQGPPAGKVVVDLSGEIRDASGDWLPFGLGPQCLVGIERLPDSSQTTWHVRRFASLSDVTRNSPLTLPNLPPHGTSGGGPPHFGPGGPPFSRGPRGRFGYSQPATVVVVPVRQVTEYRLGAKSADGTIAIQKHYELQIVEPGGEPSPLSVSGDGTLLLDSRAGLVRSLHFTGKLSCDGKESSLVVPFTYNYKLADAASGTLAHAAPPAAAISSAAPPPATPASPGTPAAGNPPTVAQTPPAAEAAKERQPLPDKESREKAEKLVEEVFGEGLRKAHNREEKLAMVDRLVAAAGGEKDPAQRFALLNRARLAAISAGDLAAARQVADEMVGQFQIDPRKANMAVLQAVAETAAGPQNVPVAEFAIALLEGAMAEDRFDAAEELYALALCVGRKCGEAEILKRLQQRGKDLHRCRKAFDAIQDYRAALDKDPTDPAANLALGKYYCLSKHDWEKGLPLLARGSERDLKTAAERDQAGATTPEELAAVGDRWWNLAENEDGDAEKALRARALKWYQEAITNLTGLAHVRLEKRLEQYASLLPKESESQAPAASRLAPSEVQAAPRVTRPSRPAKHVPGPPQVASIAAAASTQTQIRGGAMDPEFQDVAPEGGVLIGFEVGLGKWAGRNDVIAAIRPIFRTRTGDEVLGKQHGTNTTRSLRVKAKNGFAVAGLNVKSMLLVDGFSVIFMRVANRALNPAGAYTSEWIGGGGNLRETRLGDGSLVVGIAGKENDKDCTGLGLVLKR